MSKPRVEANQDGSQTVRLRNVRLSFPDLFKARAFEEGDTPTFGATFLIEADDAEQNKKHVEAAIKAVIAATPSFKGRHPGPDRICLRNGAEKGDRGVDGYHADMHYVSSSSKSRPPVVDRDLTPLSEEDGKPYAGCYVNATIRLWAQDHKQYGKRVNAQLKAVQFLRDGEPFGESAAKPEDEFDQEDADAL